MDSTNPGTNPAPQPAPAAAMAPAPQHGSNTGTLIGAAVIVLALALGAYYFFMNDALAPTMQDEQAGMEAGSDATTEALRQTSSSDDTSAIEGDLQATDLGDMEAEMNATAETL